MININTLNQNNNYSLGGPNIKTVFSSLEMAENVTTTGNMGKLIPVMIKELQPSQSVNISQSINVQFMPFVTNLMHTIKGELISYFVPYRLIWNKWEDFITGGKDGMQMPHMPYVNLNVLLKEWISTKYIKKEEWLKIAKIINNTPDISDDEMVTQLRDNTIGNPHQASVEIVLGNITKKIILRAIERYNLKESFTGGHATDKMFTETLKAIKESRSKKNQTTLHRGIRKYFKLVELIFGESFWDYQGLPFNLEMIFIWGATQFMLIDGLEPVIKGGAMIYQEVSTLPLRAYKKIYNDWIRLADWEDEIENENDNADLNWQLLYGNYDWDYFTRARRYQVRGAMPTIPIDKHTHVGFWNFDKNKEEHRIWGNTADGFTGMDGQKFVKLGVREIPNTTNITNDLDFKFDSLMTAAALMNYYTANAKIRPRYAEHLLNRWNVNIQDSRLQLAEFLGNNNIQITSQGVVQTAPGTETKQGHITGQLWGQGTGLNINTKAQEHGIIITLLLIKPANSYELGFMPQFLKRTKFELPIPEMANLPDIAIKASELNPLSQPEDIIGWKTIYDEYRTTVNYVTGKMRPSNLTGLDTYTLARSFIDRDDTNIEKLVKSYINTDIIKQYTEEPDFILSLSSRTQTAIPIPYTSNIQLAL